MTVQQLLQEYFAANPSIRSKNTERLMATVVRHLDAHLGRLAEVSDFNDRTITSYMRFRRQAGISEVTLEYEAVKLMALWRWAALRKMVDPPLLKIKRQQPATPKALLKSQIRAIMAAAHKDSRTIGGVPGSLLLPALLGLIWETAERITAVHSVTRDDIDLARKEVTFRSRKGHGQVTRRPISRSTATALRNLLDATDLACPFAPVQVTSLYHHLDRVIKEAGLPVEKRQKFHAFRKSHASYLDAAGGDARASLEHSSETVTIKHYIDPAVASTRRPVDLLFSPYSLWQRIAFFVKRLKGAFGL